MATSDNVPAPPSARERVLNAAYDLFSRRGIHAVGTDEVIDRAGVAKATLYRHFATKNDLVLAVLQRREEIWTHGLIEAQSEQRGDTPEEQLLAIFDVMHDWFQLRDGYEGCSFINVLLELGADHPAGQASIAHIDHVRDIVRRRAVAAGLTDVEDFASSWHILMKGAIILAAVGDLEAARRAQKMAIVLIEQHRPVEVTEIGEAAG
ncbi:TetR/AcrR family transcriptional regulator [Mycobacterium montefiorense]|uniref:TetR family transcriptional regulator n=1 Tax=Mycobacterium montefiorense TaxID=154654 RepID=A0AA37PS21_9MYCO|nr:TetR/AcrR family transcriptional regulator [Mycobacterium montefiorense]MCV7428084.1 TetR/AcrR family transcriptional regulator [Mycobacterium montefiorense]GBG38205.1 TetR family transcriptional regulator [Mycobacterium montefiorense]GKU37599.1 TetR family transcriptional regulator [Mycobacterium montefiorense]GKU41292.1 TetR family transcriptional regulator [Mycobacterium montefiorense]GKU44485.1 TetR family transcriptional regulator [Mycobacterium montefiorense]